MKIKPFELERYFAKYEFAVEYLLSSSDCDGLAQAEVVGWADSETKPLWENLKLGYTESLGLPLLREEIAKLYQNITSSEVLTVVPEEGIFIALNSLLDKDDHVICTWPGYQSLYEIVESLGCELQKWQPDEDQGWKFDVDFLEQSIKPNTKLIICNFPHNPTGYLPSRKDYQRIIEIAKKHNIHVFSDEMYRFLELNPVERLPSACEIYDKAISLFGMSKTFGLAGLRTGWIITKDRDLYMKMAAMKDYTTICASAPSEILSLIALRAKERIIERHIIRIKRNLDLLEKFFADHTENFSWIKPRAGTICFPRISFSEGSDKFCEDVIRKLSIMLLPSTVYGYDNKHVRIGFGRENFQNALTRFGEYFDEKKVRA